MITERQQTIMLAETDDDERSLVRSVLELKGFEVLEAVDGVEAVDVAVMKRPDLILIQLRLPGLSGFTAIRRIRKHAELRQVPIIAVSRNHPVSDRNLAIAAGSNEHMETPIEFGRLEAVIDELLPGDRPQLLSALVH